MSLPVTYVFTDGACSGNPGPGGWGSIIWKPDQSVLELGGFADNVTNNQMELKAVIVTLQELIEQSGEIKILTDSSYVIKGVTTWVKNWEKNGWKTKEGNAVANQELWKELLVALHNLDKNTQLMWCYVRGHQGIPGNERADEIAVSFSKGEAITLFSGNKLDYSYDIENIPTDTSLPVKKKKGIQVKSLSWYVSYVNGVIDRHKQWKDCEQLVKGRSGAKYKKVSSEQEEQSVFQKWGIKK